MAFRTQEILVIGDGCSPELGAVPLGFLSQKVLTVATFIFDMLPQSILRPTKLQILKDEQQSVADIFKSCVLVLESCISVCNHRVHKNRAPLSGGTRHA